MKKIFIFAACMLLASVFCYKKNNMVAKAMPVLNDVYDQVFLNTVDNVINDAYGFAVDFVAEKELVYDIKLDPLGYVYEFSVQDNNGYAFVINSNNQIRLAELHFNENSPFLHCLYREEDSFKRIFIANSFYGYYSRGNFYLTNGNVEFVPELFDTEAVYGSDYDLVTTTQNVYYKTKTQTESYAMAQRYPSFADMGNKKNACVPISAVNILQYWDRYKVDLIPDYEPGSGFGNYYSYNKKDSTLKNLVDELYDLMQTNVNGVGTSIRQFKEGMDAYCGAKGYSVQYESCMGQQTIDYELAKQKMQSGKPLIIFLDPFGVSTVTAADGYDIIKLESGSVAHSVAGFGYKTISYVFQDDSTRTDKYICVNSGLSNGAIAYLNIDFNNTFDEVYAINII